MKSGFAAVIFCASLLGTGCHQSPANGATSSGLRNDLAPVRTTGEAVPLPGSSDLITSRSAPTSVNCGTNRQAVVRHVQLDGKTVEQIDCVAPTVASTPTAGRAVRSQRVRSEVPRRKNRSWKKSALVVGGSSAAGAGIGALIGGKKGALIGAAAAGGAGTVYEVKKRKRRQ